MDDPQTGKWYVITDKKTRWGSFLPEKLGHLDCEIKPGTAICFWHKVRAVTGEQSWEVSAGEVSAEKYATCFVRDIPLEALAEFQYPELTPGKLYWFESGKNKSYLSSKGSDGSTTIFDVEGTFLVVRKVEGYNGELWEVIYEGELFVLCLACAIPVEVSDDADF